MAQCGGSWSEPIPEHRSKTSESLSITHPAQSTKEESFEFCRKKCEENDQCRSAVTVWYGSLSASNECRIKSTDDPLEITADHKHLFWYQALSRIPCPGEDICVNDKDEKIDLSSSNKKGTCKKPWPGHESKSKKENQVCDFGNLCKEEFICVNVDGNKKEMTFESSTSGKKGKCKVRCSESNNQKQEKDCHALKCCGENLQCVEDFSNIGTAMCIPSSTKKPNRPKSDCINGRAPHHRVSEKEKMNSLIREQLRLIEKKECGKANDCRKDCEKYVEEAREILKEMKLIVEEVKEN